MLAAGTAALVMATAIALTACVSDPVTSVLENTRRDG